MQRIRHPMVHMSSSKSSRSSYYSDKEHTYEQKPHKYRHLIFAPQIMGSLFKRHLILTIKGLIYSTQCLKPPSMKFVKTKMVELPREDENVIKKTLVLDLDETLIHSTTFRSPNSVSILVKN